MSNILHKCRAVLMLGCTITFASAGIVIAPSSAPAQFTCDSVVPGGAAGATAGAFSVACGTNANAINGATAVGEDANATGDLATAVGRSATADSLGAVAVGNSTNALQPAGQSSTAVGTGASAPGQNSVAVGSGPTISDSAQALGANSTAVGAGARAGGDIFFFGFANNGTTALGSLAQAGA